MFSRTQYPHVAASTDSYSEELNDLKAQCGQIRDQLEQVCDQLDEQVFYKDVLEMDLDQHKETLADMTRELAEKNCVIQAQECLLLLAGEEAQKLADANATKDQIISDLRLRIESIETIDYEETNTTS